MKAKADAMLKNGLISEKQHAKMVGVAKGKTSSEAAGKIAPVEDADADDLDPKSGKNSGKMRGKESTEADDNPSGKYRKRGSDTVTRGEPIDKDD